MGVMSVYFNLFYRKSKSSYERKDELSIQLYYYFNKKKLNISSGIKVKIKDWDEEWERRQNKNPIKNTDENYIHKNLLLKQKVKEIENIVQQINIQNEIPTIELVKSYLKENDKTRVRNTIKKVHFLYLLDQYRKYINSDIRLTEGYKKSVRTCLKRIEDFTFKYQKEVGYILLISDIDNDYQQKLLKHLDSLGEQPSTIRKRLKILISIINWSRENGFSEHHIRIIKFSYEFRREVIYLEREEVLDIYKFKEFDFGNTKSNEHTDELIVDKLKGGKTVQYTNLEVYKDMLVFGCGVGCRFGDLVNLRLDNYVFSSDRTKGWFEFRMEKSRVSKKVKIPTNNLTFEIWKKYSKNKERVDYIFPRTINGNPISNQKFNKHLKYIGEKVGLNRLVEFPKFNLQGKVVDGTDVKQPLYNFISSHIVRRTFIREGLESGVPPRILMELSGHTTEKVFKRYFDTLQRELDEEGRKLFSFDLDVPQGKNTVKKSKSIKQEEVSLEEELTELKNLYDRGLIPESIYNQKVSDLL